ncbi:MAG: HAD-IIIA family hydrolase [Phycisphaerae bacterium]|nr:HAD-IIIA family hydrolase [Phycisphaerae bacterium]
MSSGKTKAVILAAGVGSRLRPITDVLPKCLVPVRGRPIVDLWLEKLLRAGVYDVLINTHAHAGQVSAYMDQVNATGLMDVTTFHEPELLGSAGTLAANPAFADDARDLIIIYPDNVSEARLDTFLAAHRAHGLPATMLLFRAPNPRACGIATLDASGRVVAFVEKPKEPESDLANAGLYAMTADLYREVAGLRGRDIGFDVLPRLVGRMAGHELNGFHRDIGTVKDLEEVSRLATWIDAGLPGRAASQPGRAEAGTGRPAVFIDRDGTIIEQVHYIRRPEDVRLSSGAAESIAALQRAGFACVCVSNQSGLARGEITPEQHDAVHAEVERQLAAAGVRLDGFEYCPIAPATRDRRAVDHPDRKPGPGMILRAAGRLGIDIGRSWMIGDLPSDVLAGVNAGCGGTILLRSGLGPKGVTADRLAGVFIRDDLPAAARLVVDGPPVPGSIDRLVQGALSA